MCVTRIVGTSDTVKYLMFINDSGFIGHQVGHVDAIAQLNSSEQP
jgi:hypothetical protein